MALVNRNFSDIVTFTRASAALAYNSSGVLTSYATNLPRLDYDPVTLAARGLLIEEQRTNLLLRSSEFDNASWTKTRGSVAADALASPDGTTNADKLIEDSTAGNSHFVAQSATISAGATVTLSLFAKADTRSAIVLQMFNGSDQVRAAFNLSTGAVGDSSSGGTASGLSASIEAAGNGWYRCKLSAIVSTTATAIECDVMLASSALVANRFYNGDGASGLYIWGAQLEAGAFATSYIPTTTAQVTRAADVATINALSPWFNQTAGTIVAEYMLPFAAGAATYLGRVASFSDGTNNNAAEAYHNGAAGATGQVIAGGVAQAQLALGTFPALTTAKQALAYSANDFAAVLNGGAVSTDTSGTVPSVTQLRLGDRQDGVRPLNGWLRKLTYYPTRLTNAQLQALTA